MNSFSFWVSCPFNNTAHIILQICWRLNSYGMAHCNPLCFYGSHRRLLFTQSVQLGLSKPHKETFVPTLFEWSLVLEGVKEIEGNRTSKQSNTSALP